MADAARRLTPIMFGTVGRLRTLLIVVFVALLAVIALLMVVMATVGAS